MTRKLVGLGSALLVCACASTKPATPAPTSTTTTIPGNPAAGEPEIVQTGPSFHVTFAQARERYDKRGATCSGGEAPETVIGKPDQRNEMQQGRDKVVTYGYR